ncbi:hypothetical protein KA977_04325 [Candidatus Dependentiae bacterium]|nr:hypothetical protein [Candidatus Dependentiae bacterium]
MSNCKIKNNVEYYNQPQIIDRILDFYYGSKNGKRINGSKYCVGFGESEIWRGNKKGFRSGKKTEHLFEMTKEKGLDIFASLWREDGTMLALDIEYFNTTFPGETHSRPEKVFQKIEPVYQTIKKIFDSYGIDLLITMTGQGYHFTSIWPFDKEHYLLEEIGVLEDTVKKQYQNRKNRTGGEIPEYAGKGFSGAGRLLQFLTHKVIKECDKIRASGQKIIPVVYSDIPVGHIGKGIYGDGQEGVSLDLTLYSDPIYARDIRIPFSTYQKHKVMRWKVGEQLAQSTPIGTCIPRHWKNMNFTIGLNDMFNMRRRYDNKHFDYTAEYAKNSDTRIPDSSDGWKKVVADYKKSVLYNFHKTFDSKYYSEKNNPDFNIADIASKMPPCYAFALNNPNDNLFKPVFLQGISRILDKNGWHSKDIAQLFFNIYKPLRDWEIYNAEKLANFWAELYVGAIWTGTDTKTDMNCYSQQDRNLCWIKDCGFNLIHYK